MSSQGRTSIAALLLSLLLAGALAGCSDAQLTGSLGTVYPLEFEAQRVRLYSSSLSIEFVRRDGAVPVRVTVDRAALEAGAAIDLFENGDVTGRSSGGREIPRFQEGAIVFNAFEMTDGADVGGSFTAQFQVTETDTLGVKGRFSAPLELVADPGPEPPRTPEM